nr:hypothetical protein [Tanacetum cinerariifolium]
KWDKHGEKDEQATTAQIPVNATTKFVDETDFDMDFGSKIPTDGPVTVEMVNATKESFDEDDLAKFQELLLDAKKPLYKVCPDFTKLSAIVKLLNLKGNSNVTPTPILDEIISFSGETEIPKVMKIFFEQQIAEEEAFTKYIRDKIADVKASLTRVCTVIHEMESKSDKDAWKDAIDCFKETKDRLELKLSRLT